MWPLRRRSKSGPTVDPAAGDPAAAALRVALANRDWRSAHEILRTVDDPDDKCFYLEVASDVPGVQAWIAEWIEAEPRSPLPLLVRGAHAIVWAWDARGGGYAKDTSSAQFQMFARRLALAEDCLDEAIERNRDDPTGWALLITTAKGRGLGLDEAQRRFAEATARYRWHWSAHSRLLSNLCQKWGGSHELMHGFADETAAAAPGGSRLPTLVANAHLERWLEAPAGEDEKYLRTPEVRAALRDAADRSVRHPGYQRSPGWPKPHNTFAMMFWLAGEYGAAAEQFDALDGVMTELPWRYLNQPEQSFAKARARSYAKRG